MKVFITRDLEATDFFKTTLEKVGFSVFGQSLVVFSAVHFEAIPDGDWLFFYSKNGVRFFFDNLKKGFNSLIYPKKIATIGTGTADFLIQHYKIQPDFIGTGEPLQTAKTFAQIAANKTVIFPRAKHSKKSIQQQLGKVIIAKDLIVYENKPIENWISVEASIVVLTSPMNAQVYFDSIDCKTKQTVISIGNTTAKALQKLGVENVIIAKNPSKKGLVDAVLDFKKLK